MAQRQDGGSLALHTSVYERCLTQLHTTQVYCSKFNLPFFLTRFERPIYTICFKCLRENERLLASGTKLATSDPGLRQTGAAARLRRSIRRGSIQWILAGFHDGVCCKAARPSPSARRPAPARLSQPKRPSASSMSARA